MLAILHRPGLVTPELRAYLRPFVRYDAGGRCSAVLKGEGTPMPAVLAAVAAGVDARDAGAEFANVALQAYRDGGATTPCHSDQGVTGLSFILSIGAPRAWLLHRGPCAAATDAIRLECREGTVLLMAQEFHDGWHHQLGPDPGVTEERLGLVFRAARR